MEAFVLVTSGGGDGDMAVWVCEPPVEFLNFDVNIAMNTQLLKVPASAYNQHILLNR